MPSGRGPANQPARTSPGRDGLPAPAFVGEQQTQILQRN